MLTAPVCAYINWAAYDEISDVIELTEELALRELGEVARLRRLGARFDYYVMDAYWFANDGGYRTWRTPHWPAGSDEWFRRCAEEGLLPGLWIASNDQGPLEVLPEWADSYDSHARAFCMFSGGFLAHLMETLTIWADRGVRLFKFDFVNFDAVPDALRAFLLPSEIRAANVTAFRSALAAFRRERPEVLLLAYNGLDELPIQGNNWRDVRRAVDLRWLEVFDSLYCGDPRIADVPMWSFWRAKDVYSDHQVRYYQAMGFPAARIDNSAFMIGDTGTCYRRKAAAWKGMLLLSLARGGWVNTYYGEMERLSDEDGRWLARAQGLFLPLQESGRWSSFGPLPVEGRPYGFIASDAGGSLVTVVNPSQEMVRVPIPAAGEARVLFHDAGFAPVVEHGAITLSAEQMAVAATGAYADPRYDLGVQVDVVVPADIRRLEAAFAPDGSHALTATFPAPAGALRLVVRQADPKGDPLRTSGGALPGGRPLGELLQFTVAQQGRAIRADIRYDKAIWSGLSWAVAEVPAGALEPGEPVSVRFETAEPRPVTLSFEAYAVRYAGDEPGPEGPAQKAKGAFAP
ncbi:MAG TPA: hypothetical protein VGM37_06425 [Armatimonadota bacterium]|jgi:hypothetical protein